MMTAEQFHAALAELRALPTTCEYKLLYIDERGHSLVNIYPNPEDAWADYGRYLERGYSFVAEPFPAPRSA